MVSTGLLVVSNIKQIGKSLNAIEKYVKNVYIHLNIPEAKIQPLPSWGKMISQLYVDSAGLSPSIDLRVLVGNLKQGNSALRLPTSQIKPIDMIFSDSNFPDVCEDLRSQLNISSAPIYLNDLVSDINTFQKLDQETKSYNTVVLGGTFDRIHLGHKIFLTQAVLRAYKRLVVGVTAANMTKSKTLPELILPVDQRITEIKQFLNEIDATLQYDVVAIEDPYGPTQSDPNMDMIVVSAETLRGGHKVNEVRTKNNLKPLEIFCIDVVESSVIDGPKEAKISSSNTRIDLLGTRLRSPKPKPQLPKLPYIIGLTGGIASGKSKMAQYLQTKGAHVFDCDKIAHEIYEPGQVCYDKIVQHFGQEILENPGGKIDRKRLGSIVFSDAAQLEALNKIVWPELMFEVKRRIKDTKSKIIVLEAAVLLKANWDTECHEIWSMIVPPEIAIQRTMERNQLSENDARNRLKSQLENFEIVEKSNVVFSSQWNIEFTQQQADKAWEVLMKEMKQNKDLNKL